MNKLRNLYLYLVSFVSLLMILFGIIFTVQNITDVVFPTQYYNSVIYDAKGEVTEADKKLYEEADKRNLEIQITENKKNVAKSAVVVLVALPTFAYHWRKVEKEKDSIRRIL